MRCCNRRSTRIFLYNTLNSVIRLAERGKTDEVVTMIQSLSKFFRISLSKGKNIITIQEELDHIRHYLVIQSFRFKNKFRYEIAAQEEVLECQTIKLILQPIVENALYHGIEMLPDEGLISITAGLQDGLVTLRVSDNGLGMTKETMNGILSGSVKKHQRIRSRCQECARTDRPVLRAGVRACFFRVSWRRGRLLRLYSLPLPAGEVMDEQKEEMNL
ncbi:sensor histidine kinase [Paenibacillus rhizoplanae]